MTHTSRRALAVMVIGTCLVALATSLIAADAGAPAALDALFVRYDREPDGPMKDRLAARIDAVAHQKYATASRLYWHTDLALAQIAARAQGRPILHLRLLGRLDEDLSCANSRLFRVTLYADQDVSRLLRGRFVLYWSSERAVPRVTIDYGDGRRLERTTTGNSAHYVLDERGHVLDVLPGLYAPVAFRRELEESLALAARVRGASDDERARQLVEYHTRKAMAAQRDWDRLAGTPWMAGMRQLLTQARPESPLAAAQRATMTKMAVELNDLRSMAKDFAPEPLPQDQIESWSAAGRMLYGIGDRTTSRVLDATSRALVVRLHNAVPLELRTSGERLDALIARLEQTVVADSALNQLLLRPQIAREIVRQAGRIDFAALNAWIYAKVFRTPAHDPWLGLLPRDMFTGVPGDGVVLQNGTEPR